jgi:hypothetical protein
LILTVSLRDSADTALTITGSTGSNFPGQLSRLCGQEIHVA